MKNKLILDHELCRITLKKEGLVEHQVLIRMKTGGWLEHEPFPGDLKGLVNALDLAMNVISGKFWVRGVHKEIHQPMNVAQITHKKGG